MASTVLELSPLRNLAAKQSCGIRASLGLRMAVTIALVSVATSLLAVSSAVAGDRADWTGLSLGAPHHVKVPLARLSPALRRLLERKSAGVSTVPAMIDSVLGFTAHLLTFGLRHRTSLSFSGPREANCVEYANLFATAFNIVASRNGITAIAYVIRSDDPRIHGIRIPLKSFRDHDWAVVVSQGKTWDVDPTLFDFGLGWNISNRVRGRLWLPDGNSQPTKDGAAAH